MRVLILDTEFVGVDFAMRCQAAGHQVRYYQKPGKGGVDRKDGDGILTKVKFDDLRTKWFGWADLIFVTDNATYITMLEPYRKEGYPVFGPSPEGAALEIDREAGQKAMKAAGIKTIESKSFHDHDSAITYVKKVCCPLVSKPSGEADKALSYVATDAADLVYMLERWKQNPKYRKMARDFGFIIQDKMSGSEMAVGGWFGPGGWSKWITESFEFKKLMNGDLGVNTGEQGTLAMYVRKSKLFDKTLAPMTAHLEKIGYVGYIDNNSIIDDEGNIWPLEFTCRPGWPLFHNQNALHVGDPCEWMCDLMMGRDTLSVRENVPCVSVVVSIPDFPYSHFTAKEVEGIPVYHATDMDHIHPQQMMLSDSVPTLIGDKVVNAPGYVTSGDYVFVATGTGDTITGARRSAYAAVKKVKIPNSPGYRTDIGAGRLVKQLPRLQGMGFAKEFVV